MKFKRYRKKVKGNKVTFEVEFEKKIEDKNEATIQAYRIVKGILDSCCC